MGNGEDSSAVEMSERFYTGAGARATPFQVLDRMHHYACMLAQRGYVLRSGGAPGADTAFERGAPRGQKRIYLPRRGFNHHWDDGLVVGDDARLRLIALRLHPKWSACSDFARRAHTRNVAEILGHTEPPVLSTFLVCWTPNAAGGGGTGQTIRIAKAYGVPVYDLADGHNNFEKDWLS